MDAAVARARAASVAFIRDFYDAPKQQELLSELRIAPLPVPDAVREQLAPAAVHHIVVDPATAISAESRAMLAQARRNHMRLRINDELSTTITNSVHCTTLVDTRTGEPYRLPLAMLANALSAIGAQYTMQRFAKIVIRYGPSSHSTQLAFATGKVLEPGKVGFDTKRALLYALVDLMRAAGLKTVGVGTRACQNLVSTGILTFGVRLRLLQLRHIEGNHVMYDPELFPGAIIRHPLLIDILKTDGTPDADDDTVPGAGTGRPGYVYPGPQDCDADEILDDPDAEQAATDYARSLMERVGADTSDPQRVQAIVDEVLSAQAKKNIVALLFAVGPDSASLIIGGAKNVRMLRRAHAFVFEMVTACRDTPENRALEAALLRERGLPVPVDTHGTGGAASAARRGRKRAAPDIQKPPRKRKKEATKETNA